MAADVIVMRANALKVMIVMRSHPLHSSFCQLFCMCPDRMVNT